MTLDPPRWPGAPPQCPAANLPALPTREALLRFHEKNGPRCFINDRRAIGIELKASYFKQTTLNVREALETRQTEQNELAFA